MTDTEDLRPFAVALGAALRAERERQRLSLGQVTRRLARPVSISALSSWERGAVDPGWQRLADLCRVLRVRPSEMCRRTEAALDARRALTDPPVPVRARSSVSLQSPSRDRFGRGWEQLGREGAVSGGSS